MKIEDYKDILSVSDIKEILNIGQRQAYALVKTEKFKKIRIGGSRYFCKASLCNWLAGKST